MLEGVQLIDFNWRYLYVNHRVELQGKTTRKQLLGKTMMDEYPGFQHTKIFKVLKRCMEERKPQQYINQFEYPDQSKRWFQLSIEPVEEGIFILSVDITALKEAEEKTTKALCLYAFVSQVNKKIIRAKNEAVLFRHACKLALKFGKFKMAWIAMFDNSNKKIITLEHCGMPKEEDVEFIDALYQMQGPEAYVLKTGQYYFCNNIPHDSKFQNWKPFSARFGIQSGLVLPIKIAGKMVGTFNLYAQELNFYQQEKINLLVDVAADISFALENFEKAKNEKKANALIVENKKQHEYDTNNLKALINNTKDLMWSVDRDFKLITSNKKFDDFIEPIVRNKRIKANHVFLKGFPPEQLLRYQNFFTRALGGEVFTEMEHTKTPKEIWSQVSFFPIHKGENIIGIACHLHNITRLKKAERELEKSEIFNRAVLNSLKSNIVVIDATGDIVAVNNGWKDFAMQNGDPLLQQTGIGCNYFNVCNKAAVAGVAVATEVLQGIKNVMAEKEHFFYLEYPCHSPKEQRWFAMRVTKFEIEGQMVVISHQDITERIKISNDLIKHNQALQQFTYIISHNLRAPVANIIGLVNAIHSKEISMEDEHKMIAHLLTSAKKLDEIIKDLNQILQVKQDISIGQKEKISFADIMVDIQISMGTLIEKEEALLVVNFSEVQEMLSIKSYLFSIFLNLITNSIKYRLSNIKPIIQITSKKMGHSIALVFTDNGLGFNLEKQKDQIFGLYKRFHLHTEGRGMGLYMVKTQVEMLGGKVYVESRLNQGATFTLEFENAQHT